MPSLSVIITGRCSQETAEQFLKMLNEQLGDEGDAHVSLSVITKEKPCPSTNL